MARPKTTEMVSIRLPIGTLAKIQKLADEKGVKRYRYLSNGIVNMAQAPTSQDLELDLAEAFNTGEDR